MEIKIEFFLGLKHPAIAQIRQEVFVKEQGVAPEIEYDEKDEESLHALLFLNGVPSATGRIAYYENEGFRIGRICVKKSLRGMKLGEALVGSLIEAAKKEGADILNVHAQTRVRGFYEKLGFEALGQPFFEADIEHIAMVLEL